MLFFAPVIDVVPLPRGGVVERGEGVVLREGRADQAGDGLLQGGVERGRDLLAGRELFTVGEEGGLGVVQEARAEGRFVLDGCDVDGRRGGPLGPVFQEGLGEQVRGREGLWIDPGGPGVEAGPGRGFQPPRAEAEGFFDEGGLGQAGVHEVRDEGRGFGCPREAHEGQDVLGAGERAGVGVGEDAGEFRVGQGDLAQPGDDLAEPVGSGGGLGFLWRDVLVELEFKFGRDDPEAREAGFFLEMQELELERGQAPVVFSGNSQQA